LSRRNISDVKEMLRDVKMFFPMAITSIPHSLVPYLLHVLIANMQVPVNVLSFAKSNIVDKFE